MEDSRATPPITYKTDPTIVRKNEYNQNSLNVEIKTQPGEQHIYIVSIYVPLFRVGSLKSLINFIMVLQNIIKGRDINIVLQNYVINRNVILGDPLWVFEQKTQEYGTEPNKKYELVIQYLISRFFPPKAPQDQKICLRWGLYNPCKTKIHEFIFRVD